MNGGNGGPPEGDAWVWVWLVGAVALVVMLAYVIERIVGLL